MFSLVTRTARQHLCIHPVQYRAIQHHLTRTCPSCHQPLPSPLPACSNCWSIFPVPSEVIHHQLFELPYEPNPFTINTPLLKKRFLEAQTVCHPDAWSSKGPRKQDIAQALSARLNGAYQSLLKPLSRAEYLLELNDQPMSESDQIGDIDFVSQVMETRETIEEGTNKAEILTLVEENDAQMKETIAEIERLVERRNWPGVKEAAIRLRYLEGIQRAAKKQLHPRLRVPDMATGMRGLTQFIADIRGARVRELEEKRINKEMANIRKKFKDGNLDGYQKKKYVAKIVFTYILGYKVDIGHMEAVNLIASSKYSEKQIGYLAVTLLMHENSDFLRLVVNSIRKDLDSNNEVDNCLALHAIANVGGSEMAEALAEDVHRLLISPTSHNFVKKKAALTLLRLYRKHPEVIPAEEWALRIISIMDDHDLGVVLCVTSLVMALAQDHLDAYAVCYTKAVDRLYRIILEHEYAATYAYYKVPSPWLQIKLLRLLQYYAPSEDPTIRSALHQVLQTIMNNCAEPSRNVQHNNAQHSILFEAIGLAIHLDTSSPLVNNAAVLLARFISSKETNVRYLGLDTMAHLAARADSLEPIKKHQTTIILSLRDKDISVRRRALDLLYSMCDTDNSELIVGELLRYLKVADYALREEMVLKIAILTEKYANSYKWYVDTILQLISAAGEHVGDEVWYRVVQIVTNTQDLQEYAARMVLEHLKTPSTHESLVKVGGYILGEYGHLVANEPGYSPVEQFQLLHSKSQFCVASTRALLLTTYIKWVNVFPEIKPQLQSIFERYRHVLDADLQQRACEYYALASRPEEDDLLANVCEEMPPFPPRVSALIGRINRKHGDTGDKRIWVHGGKEANLDRQLTQRNKAADANGNVPTEGDSEDIMAALAGLEVAPSPNTVNSAGAVKEKLTAQLASGPNIDQWFDTLAYSSEGVLFEDVQIQVGIKSRYQGHLGQVAVYVGNKVQVALTSFTTTIDVQDPEALSVTFAKLPQSTIPSRSQIQVLLHVECKRVFAVPPVLNISFLAGSHQTVAVRLPIVVTKFFEHVRLGPADFFERWKLIGGPPREIQAIFPIELTSSGQLDIAKNKQVISGHGLNLLTDVDPNPNNIVGAGVLHMSADGKVGCLLRFEPNREAKLCRLTVRSTSEQVATEVGKLLQKPLKAGL